MDYSPSVCNSQTAFSPPISRQSAVTSRRPSLTPIAALPADVRGDLDALARMRHHNGDSPQAVVDAVNRAAWDHGYTVSGAAVLVREAVPQLSSWSPLADFKASFATLPAEMEAWQAAQPRPAPASPTAGLSPEGVERRERWRKRRHWKQRVVGVVRNVLVKELPEAVGVLLAQQKGGKTWAAA